MKNISIILIIFLTTTLFAQKKDSIKTYWLNSFEVTAQRTSVSNKVYPIGKGDLNKLINNNGFTFIRKGVFFAQDVYSDGLKRSDINVLIDGERYHSACPNRMDSPITRVNPLDIKEIELTKSSCSVQSGIGGLINFRRSYPGDNLKVTSQLSGSTDSYNSVDFASSVSANNLAVDLRYSSGETYNDGEGRGFTDLYNYTELKNFQLGEINIKGKGELTKYGVTFSYTDNISFPYLMMDERVNRIFSGFFSYKDNKVYFNYTDHMMDNGLRAGPMYMKSVAKNLTIGFIRDNVELYYRNWDINNFFKSSQMEINNHMMPEVSMISGAYSHKWNYNNFNITAKGGLVYQFVGDTDNLKKMEVLYASPDDKKVYPIASLSVSYTKNINEDFGFGLLTEFQTEAPELESRYIAVNKPMLKADWIGNPDLSQVKKITLRGLLNYKSFNIEPFFTNLWDYANLKGLKIGLKPYQTYENIDAYIMGVNFSYNSDYLNITASYNYGQNNSGYEPLAEIAPLRLRTIFKSPEYYNFSLFLIHTYNDAQTRVSDILKESQSLAWNKIDLGINKKWNRIKLTLAVENLLDVNYSQHLSYLRNPFASGAKVFEPGRKISLTIKFDTGI